MVGHRRVTALAAALLIAFMVPALAPPGVARAAQPDPVVWPVSISGVAVGRDGGSLQGGSVAACSVGPWGCFTGSIDWGGNFSIGVPSGSYQVAISPPAPYAFGYYAAWDVHGFTTDPLQASTVGVTTVDVSLLTMYVPRTFVPPPPPTFGSISGFAVGALAGSLAGGTVTACDTLALWSCTSGTIGLDGSYWVGTLAAGSYIVSITPPAWTSFVSGYYSSFSPGNFSTSAAAATAVTVWNTNVSLPTIVVPGWAPGWASISGRVVGTFSGSLAGGTVTACHTTSSWTCASATIASDGSYWIGVLPAGSYFVGITPPTSAYLAGWYAAGWSGNFTTSASQATPVTVWASNVALPTIVVPGYSPTWGSLSGYAVGTTSGALAGGSVTACNVSWSCVSTTIGSNGWYSIGNLPYGSYTVMVTPLANAGYQAGYYAAGFTGNFTTSSSSATAVSLWSTNVTVPTITVPATVPPNTGGIVVTTPQAYVVWAYLRPEFATGHSTSLRVPEGSRAELASMIDPKLSGMRVEVWRRLAGKSWVLITTRGISGEGWVIYRFTATRGTNGAQFRFHLPATTLTLSVWSIARTVRLS